MIFFLWIFILLETTFTEMKKKIQKLQQRFSGLENFTLNGTKKALLREASGNLYQTEGQHSPSLCCSAFRKTLTHQIASRI